MKKIKKFDFATLKDGLIVSRIIHKMHESNLKINSFHYEQNIYTYWCERKFQRR